MGLNRCTLQVRNASLASSLLCLVCVLVGSLGELLDLEVIPEATNDLERKKLRLLQKNVVLVFPLCCSTQNLGKSLFHRRFVTW